MDCGWEPDLAELHRRLNLGPVPLERMLDEVRRRSTRGDRHLHADNILPVEERPDLRFDLNNLATRCNTCHNARTMRQANQRATSYHGLQRWGVGWLEIYEAAIRDRAGVLD